MHTLLRLLLITSFAGSAARADDRVAYPAKDGPGKGKTILFLAGDEEYRSEEGLPMLAKILSQKYGFNCTVTFSVDKDGFIDPNASSSMSAPDALDKADGLVLGLRFRKYPDAVMEKFAAAVKRGVPIVGLRTSTHSFRGLTGKYAEFNHFGREVLGEDWVNHWGANYKYATRGILEESAKGEAILNGVADIFGDSGPYEAHPQPDSKILFRAQVVEGMKPTDPPSVKKQKPKVGPEQGYNEPMMPAGWTRIYKGPLGRDNRVFCTTMGAATDLQNEGLRRLVVNAVLWGFELEIPAKADVAYIDEYKPIPYNAGKYRRGLKPEDHALGKVLPQGKPAEKK